MPDHDSVAKWACPDIQTVNIGARVDIRDPNIMADGRTNHYLIHSLEQAFAAASGNVAKLSFASKPDRWLVGGKVIAPTWTFVYHLSYTTHGHHGDFQPCGETWFATHPDYPDVYFWFAMPVKVSGVRAEPDPDGLPIYETEYSEHPKCGYGSALRTTVDALLKPRL
jgi:hypothetical protein